MFTLEVKPGEVREALERIAASVFLSIVLLMMLSTFFYYSDLESTAYGFRWPYTWTFPFFAWQFTLVLSFLFFIVTCVVDWLKTLITKRN